LKPNGERIMRRSILFLLILWVGSIAGQSVSAQETASQTLMTPLPEHTLLNGLTIYWQQFNRCSAAALTIQISYWSDDADYETAANRLNPNSADVSVRFDEMIAFAETYGLRGVARMGGTTDMLKRLVVNGFPVLVENAYYVGDRRFQNWTSHNRVIVGYDDVDGVFYALDSVLGGGPDDLGRPFDYAEFEENWRELNHGYLVLYKPEDETRLQEVMGQQWDVVFNAEWTLARAQARLYTDDHDGFDNFNMGMALVELGEYERAIEAFAVAKEIGLPLRMLWYQFGPFEAYLGLERYDDVITRGREVLAYSPHVEEMYYYIARAYLAQGNLERAEANLEVATGRNPYYVDAMTLLDELRGE
jgi:tetratricopeptide (TPR) repeat protein